MVPGSYHGNQQSGTQRTTFMSQSNQRSLSSSLVSSLQAVMATSAGWTIVSSCRDVMEDRHWLADAYILFATPYFCYDLLAMFLCYWFRLRVKGHQEAWPDGGSVCAAVLGFLRREVLMVLHHVFMVAFCCPASLVWRQGRGDYFQGLLFLAELSTPSVCLGKVLIQKQDWLLHRVNGAALLLSFFCCRVLLFPYLYYNILLNYFTCRGVCKDKTVSETGFYWNQSDTFRSL
uniref:TLC domain containing 3B n=1 Tax=Poecilia reticulata TaxID=8081 RepID=A0A3P9P514_POERE